MKRGSNTAKGTNPSSKSRSKEYDGAANSRSGRRDTKAGSSSSAARDPGTSMASSNKRPKTESSAPATPSAMIPSYLRARFSDKGSALRDQPSSRRRQLFSEGEEPAVAASSSSASSPVKPKKLAMGKNGAARPKGKAQGGSNKSSGVGSGLIKVSEEAEGDEDVNLSREQRRNRRRGEADLELMDNNVLLFGRWYRRLGVDAPPQLSHLKSFVMDRKAYWGDEIALRVFAGALKVVLIVVLQAEERLQCVFPPNGGASGICYLVLTHRGNVPHYRGVSVTGKHYLKLDHSDNTDPTGNAYITSGMVGRLLEDCPSGWEEHLTPQSMRFLGVGQDGGGTKNARSPSKGHQPGLLAKGVGVAQTSRRMVVRNSETLKEVTSEVAIRQLKGEGKAMETWVIEGFPAGCNFVERIACSPLEANPRFSLSKTPGDGDCLFYAMADVADEVSGVCASPRQSHKHASVDSLRSMVSDSLTDTELAFFRAANDF